MAVVDQSSPTALPPTEKTSARPHPAATSAPSNVMRRVLPTVCEVETPPGGQILCCAVLCSARLGSAIGSTFRVLSAATILERLRPLEPAPARDSVGDRCPAATTADEPGTAKVGVAGSNPVVRSKYCDVPR